MDISTGNWFEYLREEVLTEGLRDIGLPESVVDFIESAMPNAPEKAKTYAGNEWKKYELPRNGRTFAQRNWEGFMERTFKDEIQVIPPEDRSAAGNAPYRARTMTPYYVGGVDDKPVVRKEYDDEMIEQNKRIVFVAQNVLNVLAKPSGAWRKAFMKAVKALSKAGVESEKVEKVKEELAATMLREFKGWWYNYDKLFAWLNDEPTNYELIKSDNIETAFQTAIEDLENREDPNMVIHQFDNGLYWYNLNTYNCSIEGERMGHCGSDSRGVLVSLRERKEKRKASSSYVTMTWNEDDQILYQIKGRGNNAPDSELWEYISWFIQNAPINSVHETGEHSSDLSGFEEMNEYLQGENPDVNFEGMINIDDIQEAVDEVVNNYEGDYTSLYVEVQDPNDWGGDGQYAYISIQSEMSFEVDLGWPDIVRRDNDFYSADEVDSGDINDMLDSIPFDSYGREARAFVSEIGLDDLGYELPGEDAEVEYEVVMLVGAQPDDVPAGAEKQTAHLRVLIRSNESVSADNADDAVSEVEFIARELRNLEESMEDYIQAVRSQLVDGEYIAKGAYDRTRGDLVDKTFEHWDVTEGSGGSLEFAWRSDGSQNVINDGGEIPQVIKMYGQDYDRNITELYSRIFGSPMSRTSPPRTENPDLNRNMARNLENLYKAKQENPDQQQMKFGPEYAAKAARIILAKDSHFIIQGTNSAVGQNSKYPTQPIGWMYKINMNYKTSEAEIQVTQDILDFFNENPEMMNQAAQKTIQDAMNGILALAQTRKDEISSGKAVYPQIRRIESMMGARAEANHLAMKGMMIATWINQNFEQMDEVEKYVSYYKYLRPIVNQQIARIGPIQTDGDDAGKPDYFDQEVRTQLVLMGATRSQMDSRTQDPISGRMGEPRPAQESVEAQIDRIEKLLSEQENIVSEKDETYDLRIYKLDVNVSVQKNLGGEIQETQTEIRGIEGVTTVRTVGDTTDVGTAHVATYEIKFELIGNQGRVRYRDRVLLPNLMNIKGLKILRVSPIHRTNVRGTIRTVRESLLKEAGFGGEYGGTAIGFNHSTSKMPSNRMDLESIADDWGAASVMAYDAPMDTTDMRYHVMMPVEDLLKYTSREFRAPKDAFDGMYQNFIKNGAQAPVYVAVGKNRRIKITGNEDLIWFAKRAGLRELPVFLSYQRQV